MLSVFLFGTYYESYFNGFSFSLNKYSDDMLIV